MPDAQIESYGQLRHSLADLFEVRLLIYWADFLTTSTIGWVCFWEAMHTSFSSPWIKIAWLLAATFSFFRDIIFIHEIAHIRAAKFLGFRIAWNMICGMVFLLPDYMYATHKSHHLITTFSTVDDPEYVPAVYQKWFELLAPFIIIDGLLPFAMAIRLLIVGPLSIAIGGAFRNGVLRHASTLKMNPRFMWKDITPEERRASAIGDLGTCMVWSILLLVFHNLTGLRVFLLNWYIVSYSIAVVNHFRSLLRHRYTNVSMNRVNFDAQLLDSITIVGFSPLATLFNPVGLRYHSVHHMFPDLPYYSLLKAHQRIVASLPGDHFYHKTLVKGFWTALGNFVATCRESHKQRIPECL